MVKRKRQGSLIASEGQMVAEPSAIYRETDRDALVDTLTELAVTAFRKRRTRRLYREAQDQGIEGLAQNDVDRAERAAQKAWKAYLKCYAWFDECFVDNILTPQALESKATDIFNAYTEADNITGFEQYFYQLFVVANEEISAELVGNAALAPDDNLDLSDETWAWLEEDYALSRLLVHAPVDSSQDAGQSYPNFFAPSRAVETESQQSSESLCVSDCLV